MALLWKPRGLGEVDCSNAQPNECIVLRMNNGQLVLIPCRHREGNGRAFCLDRMSFNPSLNEKLRSRGHLDEDDQIVNPRTFPHIGLVGLPRIGDRPISEINIQHNRYMLHYMTGLIVEVDFDTIDNLMQPAAA